MCKNQLNLVWNTPCSGMVNMKSQIVKGRTRRLPIIYRNLFIMELIVGT